MAVHHARVSASDRQGGEDSALADLQELLEKHNIRVRECFGTHLQNFTGDEAVHAELLRMLTLSGREAMG